MNKSLSWKGISLIIDSNLNNKDNLINILENEGIKLRDQILENQSNYFIFENEFINQSTDLSMMLAKYTKKNYKKEAKVYVANTNEFKIVKANSDDIKKYKKIISQNILDGEFRKIDISVNVMNEVLNDNVNSKMFLDILILLALANKCSYDAENLVAEFRTEDSYFTKKITVINNELIDLYPIYDWIFNDDEYEDSYNVKLHIVRQVITIKQDLKNVEVILEDSKLAYKRIISKKTKDYFDQLNQLKDDFLVLSQNENSTLRTLHLTFFAWISYLGIELFKIITDYNGTNIINYLFYSSGIKKAIVIFMFIVALVIIFTGYVSEVKSLQNSYAIIKKIYKDKILFETDIENESKFEKIIKEPKVGNSQLIIFVIILIALIIRLLIAFV